MQTLGFVTEAKALTMDAQLENNPSDVVFGGLRTLSFKPSKEGYINLKIEKN